MFLLDTVLSNFALVGRADLLPELLGVTAVTTTAVINEFNQGVVANRVPTTDWTWLVILELAPEETKLYSQLLTHINAGEASCLAIAARRNGRLVTDDRDARKIANQMQVPVSSTLGILVQLFEKEHLSLAEANYLLERMIARGYRSPLRALDSLLMSPK
jgi:hypothetical protein